MTRIVRGWPAWRVALALALAATFSATPPASAQAPAASDDTRAGTIAAAQQEKAKDLKPYEPNKAEIWVKKLEEQFLTGSLHWHPFFTSAYSGGGFTLGAGYTTYVSSYNTIDFRGSWTPSGYLRAESEFLAPRLFDRRAKLSAIGGWRKATQVGFYGFGTPNTSAEDRANYSFNQPYASATLDLRPTRRILLLVAGAEYSQWDQGAGEGNKPSVDEIYTPDELPGLGQKVTYLHLKGTAAIDWRTSEGYSRKGGYYGVTFNNFNDSDDLYSFKRVDYEVIQHVPVLRDAWVLSLHGRVETTSTKDGNQVPFFMMPALGGGSSLRGYASWRFRDLNSLLLQAEWRVLVNSFLDVALFYDAGKVEARAQDLDLDGLKSDFGIGFRMHGPAATPVRIELAKGNEGLAIVFAASASF
jgi:outer membrane protein assembly factor BamA